MAGIAGGKNEAAMASGGEKNSLVVEIVAELELESSSAVTAAAAAADAATGDLGIAKPQPGVGVLQGGNGDRGNKPQPGVEILQESNRDHGTAAPAAGQKSLKPMVKVPPRSIFNTYSERYLSPTDSLVSPISKGLLAKNRKGLRMLMPLVPPKALETTFHRMNNENRVAK